MAARTLSKSRFKLAVECPTKVFYSLDKRYVNAKDEDEFLQALADGGFQVGDGGVFGQLTYVRWPHRNDSPRTGWLDRDRSTTAQGAGERERQDDPEVWSCGHGLRRDRSTKMSSNKGATMSQQIRVKLMPTMAELMPVVVQVAIIATLLAMVSEDYAMTMLGGVAGLVWLRVSHVRLAEQYNELRLQRRQFIALGAWLGRDNASEEFDRMASETMMIDGSIEGDSYMAAVVSDSIANAVRTGAAVLLQVYLLVAAYRWWAETHAT